MDQGHLARHFYMCASARPIDAFTAVRSSLERMQTGSSIMLQLNCSNPELIQERHYTNVQVDTYIYTQGQKFKISTLITNGLDR